MTQPFGEYAEFYWDGYPLLVSMDFPRTLQGLWDANISGATADLGDGDAV